MNVSRTRSIMSAIGSIAIAASLAILPFPNSAASAQDKQSQRPKHLIDLMEPGPLPDLVFGQPDAPVSVVAYLSMSCSHCASFYENVVPHLQKQYVESGKAQLILRDHPHDASAIAASMLVNCVDSNSRYPLYAALLSGQNKWIKSKEWVRSALEQIAGSFGMSEKAVDECFRNRKLLDKISAAGKRARELFAISGTPSVFVNGKQMEVIRYFDWDKNALVKEAPKTSSNSKPKKINKNKHSLEDLIGVIEADLKVPIAEQYSDVRAKVQDRYDRKIKEWCDRSAVANTRHGGWNYSNGNCKLEMNLPVVGWRSMARMWFEVEVKRCTLSECRFDVTSNCWSPSGFQGNCRGRKRSHDTINVPVKLVDGRYELVN